jgi:sialidase-1
MLQLADAGYKDEQMISVKLSAPLNENCFENGVYADVYQATKLDGFSVVDKWKPTDGKTTRAGFVDVPVLEASKAGSSFTFSFIGNAVGIAIVSGSDAGIIEYRIDNGKIQTLNLFTQWSNSLHLPWYLILGDNLNKGRHVLEVKTVLSQKNSGRTACRIVHFLVNK